jgi:glutamate-1-semialdehyde 2,1-aminomutase
MSTTVSADGATTRSARLYERAAALMPGGTTRTTVFTPPFPPYAERGHGCRIVDVDGNERLDFLGNYTALIHGYGTPEIVEALTRQLASGPSFPLPTRSEVELAELLRDRVRSVERIWFTGSGSEAVMLAIKVARAATGRTMIAKCEGAYHGTYDSVQVNVGARPIHWEAGEPEPRPEVAGLPRGVLDDVVVIPFNDPVTAERVIFRHRHELAAVLADPVPNRVGLIPPSPEYLATLRRLTAAHGIVLVFDEVLSFRTGYHGAQGRYGIDPDLTTFGKIIGGGLPIGAVGGSRDVMEVLDPHTAGPRAPHGGTFNANPMSMVAGLAAMRLLTPEALDRLDALGERLRSGLAARFAASPVRGCVTGVSSLLRIHLGADEVVDYSSAYPDREARERTGHLYRYLLDNGILIAPYGMACVSAAMTESDIDRFIEVVDTFLSTNRWRAMKKEPPDSAGRITRPPRLKDAIAEQLRTMILDGLLTPGTALRQEQLAEHLGVSRMPLRQALQQLDQEGLVAFSPAGTAKVVDLTRGDIGELLDIREVVDGLAARVLARRGMSPAAASRLQVAMSTMRTAIEKSERATYFIANAEFHLGILRATQYRRLNQFAGTVQLSAQAAYLTPREHKERLLAAEEEHRGIFDAIQKGEGKLAERLARQHIKNAWGHRYLPGDE